MVSGKITQFLKFNNGFSLDNLNESIELLKSYVRQLSKCKQYYNSKKDYNNANVVGESLKSLSFTLLAMYRKQEELMYKRECLERAKKESERAKNEAIYVPGGRAGLPSMLAVAFENEGKQGFNQQVDSLLKMETIFGKIQHTNEVQKYLLYDLKKPVVNNPADVNQVTENQLRDVLGKMRQSEKELFDSESIICLIKEAKTQTLPLAVQPAIQQSSQQKVVQLNFSQMPSQQIHSQVRQNNNPASLIESIITGCGSNLQQAENRLVQAYHSNSNDKAKENFVNHLLNCKNQQVADAVLSRIF